MVRIIRRRMLEAQGRQKCYVDWRRKPLEFSISDHILLRVSPTKGVKRFGLIGELAPRYIGPFQISERIGAVAYWLALSPSLAGVHAVFHVSMLRRYVPDLIHVLIDNLSSPFSLTSLMRRFRYGFWTGKNVSCGTRLFGWLKSDDSIIRMRRLLGSSRIPSELDTPIFSLEYVILFTVQHLLLLPVISTC